MSEIINLSLFELIDSQNIEEIDNDKKDINIDDSVRISYDGKEYIGKVKRIYNNGDTFNVSFDGKVTAFHKSKIIRA